MFTVYDFINGDIESKRMRFGWLAHVEGLRGGALLVIDYTMLNFDWDSLKFLNEEVMGMFLNSASYSRMRSRLDRAMRKFGRLRFEATSVSDMKLFMETSGLKVDVDKLLEKLTRRKSEKIAERIKDRPVKAVKTTRKPSRSRRAGGKRARTSPERSVSRPAGLVGQVYSDFPDAT